MNLNTTHTILHPNMLSTSWFFISVVYTEPDEDPAKHFSSPGPSKSDAQNKGVIGLCRISHKQLVEASESPAEVSGHCLLELNGDRFLSL